LVNDNYNVLYVSYSQGVGGEDTFETRFYTPLAGSIWLRTWNWEYPDPLGTGNGSLKLEGSQSILYSDVFNSFDGEPKSTDHDWMLYITDILDSRGISSWIY